jgi:hypothetical protein
MYKAITKGRALAEIETAAQTAQRHATSGVNHLLQLQVSLGYAADSEHPDTVADVAADYTRALSELRAAAEAMERHMVAYATFAAGQCTA